MQCELKVGDSVQSHYSARWYGQVREIIHRKYQNHKGQMIHDCLARVIMLLDKAGNKQRKTKVVKYHESHFHKVSFDVMEAYLDKVMEKYDK